MMQTRTLAPGLSVRPEGDARSLSPGDTVDRYIILERIGQGGMGVVYAAYDPDLDRKIALKFLRSDRDWGPNMRNRVLREAQALARLSHPNVVTVHDVGAFGEQVYIAMEFVAGRTMTEWLSSEPRSVDAIVARFMRAGDGLRAAHAAGLVHRDFKPDNILVGDDGRVVVVDFGLARSTEAPTAPGEASITDSQVLSARLTVAGAFSGTPAYMSPEQFLGEPVDARSDQFSFCVALWEALTQRRPFAGESIDELKKNVCGGVLPAIPPESQVPPGIIGALSRGLALDPGRRFSGMDELLRQIARGYSADPTGDRRTRHLLLVTGGIFVGGTCLSVVPTFVSVSDRPLVVWPAISLVYLGVMSTSVWFLSARLLSNRVDRGISITLILGAAALCIVRVSAVLVGMTEHQLCVADLATHTGVMSMAGVFVARWMAWLAASLLGCLIVTVFLPEVSPYATLFAYNALVPGIGAFFWLRDFQLRLAAAPGESSERSAAG